MTTRFAYGNKTNTNQALVIKFEIEFAKSGKEFLYTDYQKCIRIAKELRVLDEKYNKGTGK